MKTYPDATMLQSGQRAKDRESQGDFLDVPKVQYNTSGAGHHRTCSNQNTTAATLAGSVVSISRGADEELNDDTGSLGKVGYALDRLDVEKKSSTSSASGSNRDSDDSSDDMIFEEGPQLAVAAAHKIPQSATLKKNSPGIISERSSMKSNNRPQKMQPRKSKPKGKVSIKSVGSASKHV